jgi:sucrose phosphorylase
VPHKDNISYFGNGTNEAQLVYQFPLVPLVLHTVLSGDVTRLRNWAAELEPPGNETTFFNFLASHDGMGLVPARGLLEEAEVQHLVDITLRHGGQVSYKNNPDGSQSPYELNITLFDALNDPAIVGSLQTKIDRFMVSQVILLSLAGVPGIYFHSLLGSSSWHEGFKETERARTLNREKLDFTALEAVLADGKSRAAKIFNRYATLISIRTAQKAFHPNARQQVLSLDSALFTLLRTSEDGSEQILVIANVSGQLVNLFLPKSYSQYQNTLDLLGGWHYNLDSALTLQPYQAMWLRLIDTAHR